MTKADLLRSYDWLSVSSSAVSDLDKMYRRAYGGPDEVGAISGLPAPAHRVMVPEPVIRSDDDDGFISDFEDDPNLSPTQIGLAVTTFEMTKPPSPKGPVLKLQTNFDTRPVLKSKWDYDDEDKENSAVSEKRDMGDEEEEEDGDRTARPLETLPMGFTPWSTSIDHVLSAGVTSPGGNSIRDGPMTPNGYDDISPITRGEWGFLMVDDAFQGGRTVAVETC